MLLFWAALLLPTWQVGAAQAVSAADYFERGTKALQAADYSHAEADFLAVLRLEPRNLGALGNLGVLYAKTDRRAKAIATYERALRLAPHEQGLLLNLGLAYFKGEEYQHALPLFSEIESSNPSNLQAQELAAACRIYTGDLPRAIASLESLRRTDPNHAGVLYLLGVALTRNKQPEHAKAVFAEMLSLSTSPAQSNFLLGKAYYEGGQFTEAEAALRNVLKEQPLFPGARLEFARVLISERENDRATSELESLLQDHPDDPEALYLLGAFHVQLERYADGLPYLLRAEKTYPESWALQFYLGKAQFRTGQTGKALTRLQRAAELNPNEATVYYLLSQALRQQGKTTASQVALQKVKQLQSRNLQKEETALQSIPKPQ